MGNFISISNNYKSSLQQGDFRATENGREGIKIRYNKPVNKLISTLPQALIPDIIGFNNGIPLTSVKPGCKGDHYVETSSLNTECVTKVNFKDDLANSNQVNDTDIHNNKLSEATFKTQRLISTDISIRMQTHFNTGKKQKTERIKSSLSPAS